MYNNYLMLLLLFSGVIMNIEIIRDFTKQEIPSKDTCSVSKKEDKFTLVALKKLCKNDDWLENLDLAKNVALRLENFASTSAPARTYAIAAYAKILQKYPSAATSGGDDSYERVEEKTLATEFALLRNLSEETSPEVLNHFVTYLTTGKTDFISNENVIEILQLAHEHHFEEIALKCIMYVLNPDSTFIGEEEGSSSTKIELSNMLVVAKQYMSAELDKDALLIKMRYSPCKKSLECLKKIHQFVPIKHLQIEHSIDTRDLLDLVEWNPGLLSLSVRSELSNADLEKLSQNLLNLEKLSLTDGMITALPEAISLRVKELHLCCNQLIEINVPNAEQVAFFNCSSLKMIHIPKALNVTIQSCDVASLEIPSARRVICTNCRSLKSIDAPRAEYFDCRFNDSLTRIDASSAEHLDCQFTALIDIEAPCADYIDCQNTPTLKSLSAPKATTLLYPHHKNFTTLYPPRVWGFKHRDWNYFTVEVQKELFHAAYRRCIRSHEGVSDLFYYMDDLGHNVSTLMTPFEKCFRAISRSIPPQETNSQWEDELALLQKDLISASEHNSPDTIELVLNFLSRLQPLNNPKQQINRLRWIGTLLTSEIPLETLLGDSGVILKTIGNLTDESLQTTATNLLLSLYEGQPKRLSLWRALSTEKNPRQEAKIFDHQLLPCLFLMEMGIEKPIIEELVAGLKYKIYKKSKLINSISEVLSLLIAFSTDPSSSLLAKKTIHLILDPTERKVGEGLKVYNQRLVAHRKQQKALIRACKTLLSSDKFNNVKGNPTAQDIININEKILWPLGTNISTEVVSEAFNSTRFPSGILTYAAFLQTLDDSHNVIRELGRFIEGVMNKQFPDMRYDLDTNPHLKTIFENNSSLLEKWRAPLSIDLKKINLTGDYSRKWERIESTEQWEDLLLMGTEVNGSCQDLDVEILGTIASYNKCLMAYALDGKNKLIIVRNSQGKIAARAVLRILWNKEKQQPVLFMEKIYTNATNQALHDLIKIGCQQKAEEMGLPLLCETSILAKLPSYKGVVSSLGCDKTCFEYVDAIKKDVTGGCFDISESCILYDPSPVKSS